LQSNYLEIHVVTELSATSTNMTSLHDVYIITRGKNNYGQLAQGSISAELSYGIAQFENPAEASNIISIQFASCIQGNHTVFIAK
jgi:hypothetical protein